MEHSPHDQSPQSHGHEASRDAFPAPDGESARGFGRGWVPAARDIGLPGEGRGSAPIGAAPPHPPKFGPGGGGAPDWAAFMASHPGQTYAAGQQERAGDHAPRSNIFTPERQVAFLAALAGHGNVRAACALVGLSPQAAYTHRRRDAALAQGWEAALVLARDVAEQVLADRALNGTAETVYYRGEAVGHRVRFDTRLLLAHLARLDQHCLYAERGQATAARFDEFLDAMLCGEADAAEFADGDGWIPDAPSRPAFIVRTMAEAVEALPDELAQEEARAQGIDLDLLRPAKQEPDDEGDREHDDEEDDEEENPLAFIDEATDTARRAARADAIAEWDEVAAARHARIDALCLDEAPALPSVTGLEIAVREAEPLAPVEVKSLPLEKPCHFRSPATPPRSPATPPRSPATPPRSPAQAGASGRQSATYETTKAPAFAGEQQAQIEGFLINNQTPKATLRTVSTSSTCPLFRLRFWGSQPAPRYLPRPARQGN